MGKTKAESRPGSAAYRKVLLDKKAELQAALGNQFKKLSEAERTSEDDLSIVSQEEVLHLGLNHVLYGQLRQVESALERVKAGKYGRCADCGAAISAKRLRAIPWAKYCVDCQDKKAAENATDIAMAQRESSQVVKQ